MSKFGDLASQHWTGEVAGTADAIMRALKLSAHQRQALTEPITGELHKIAGKMRLGAERSAFAAPSEPDATKLNSPPEVGPSRPVPTLPDLRRLLDQSFSLDGRGASTTWGAATVEQHRQRIAYLAKKREGITETIGQHEQVVQLCLAHGVSTLAQVYASPRKKAA